MWTATAVPAFPTADSTRLRTRRPGRILNAGARTKGMRTHSAARRSLTRRSSGRCASPRPIWSPFAPWLDRRANPNIAVDGIPLLVVAATLLHADVVGVLVTAGADPLVKVAGIAHPVYNSSGALPFHSGGLAGVGLSRARARQPENGGDICPLWRRRRRLILDERRAKPPLVWPAGRTAPARGGGARF